MRARQSFGTQELKTGENAGGRFGSEVKEDFGKRFGRGGSQQNA